MQKRPVRNFFKIRKEKRILLHAMTEGERDILNPAITDAASTSGVVDKNNYTEYSAQVDRLYEMYDARSDYGAEICKGIIDTWVAFIGGEGINVTAKGATAKYIEKFLKYNKLSGSRLLDMMTIGALEGRCLTILKKDTTDKNIKVRNIPWITTKYDVEHDKIDIENIKKITYTDDNGSKQELKGDYIYTKLGGSRYDIKKTSNRFHSVVTQIENFSRAAYDLRKNTHVFGKYMPYWKTADAHEAKALNNQLTGINWEIGYGYAGAADFSIVEPSGAAAKAIIEDILINLKSISATTGLPIHWLAWPELMSNRATADSLIEVIMAATKKERLIWEESFYDIIKKSMEIAVEQGFEKSNIIGDFEVSLPIVSIALLKQIAEVWIPLLDAEIVHISTVRNKVPGIDPLEEQKKIEADEKEAAEKSPMINRTTDETLNQLQNGQNIEQGEQNAGNENGIEQGRSA